MGKRSVTSTNSYDLGVHLTVAIARLLAGHVGPQGGGLRYVVHLPHATVVYQVIIQFHATQFTKSTF